MAAKKTVAKLVPPAAGEWGATENKGQSYQQRVQKGKKELALWLDMERIQKIQTIQKRLGLKSVKEAIEHAVDELFSRVIRGGVV